MLRIFTVILLILSLNLCSCLAAQLKWDRDVQGHMETLLTTPDETVNTLIEEWNSQENMKEGLKVDLELIQENVERVEFDNKKGHCIAYYKRGLDMNLQRVIVGQVMVVFGNLYWLLPEQKRETIYVYGMLEDTETLVFSWTKGQSQPVIDNDRLQNFM